jgi:IS30 family transposase
MTEFGGDSRDLARITEQLEELKRLMIVQLLASGVQSAHIAKALGIHPSAISRIVPVRDVQKVAAKRNQSLEG